MLILQSLCGRSDGEKRAETVSKQNAVFSPDFAILESRSCPRRTWTLRTKIDDYLTIYTGEKKVKFHKTTRENTIWKTG